MRWWRFARRNALGSGRSTAELSTSPPFDAWRSLPPIQRTVAPLRPVASTSAFTAALSAHTVPRFLEPLGHLVTHDAPAGLVAAASAPPLTAPVQRESHGVIDRLVKTRDPAARGLRTWVSATTPGEARPAVSRSLIAADTVGLPRLSLPAPAPTQRVSLQPIERRVSENTANEDTGDVSLLDRHRAHEDTAPLLGDTDLTTPLVAEAGPPQPNPPQLDRTEATPHTPRRIGLGAPLQRTTLKPLPPAHSLEVISERTAQPNVETLGSARPSTQPVAKPLIVRGAPTPAVPPLPISSESNAFTVEAITQNVKAPLLGGTHPSITTAGEPGEAQPNVETSGLLPTDLHTPPTIGLGTSARQKSPVQMQAPATRPAASSVDSPHSTPETFAPGRVAPVLAQRDPLVVVEPDDLASASSSPPDFDSPTDDTAPARAPERSRKRTPSALTEAPTTPRAATIMDRSPTAGIAAAIRPPSAGVQRSALLADHRPPVITHSHSGGPVATPSRAALISSVGLSTWTPIASRSPEPPARANPTQANLAQTNLAQTNPIGLQRPPTNLASPQPAEPPSVSLLTAATDFSLPSPFRSAAPQPDVKIGATDGTPTLELVGDAEPSAPIGVDGSQSTRPTESIGIAALNSTTMSDDQLDRLARRIYPRIRDQWRTELRRDRERAGRAGDLRI